MRRVRGCAVIARDSARARRNDRAAGFTRRAPTSASADGRDRQVSAPTTSGVSPRNSEVGAAGAAGCSGDRSQERRGETDGVGSVTWLDSGSAIADRPRTGGRALVSVAWMRESAVRRADRPARQALGAGGQPASSQRLKCRRPSNRRRQRGWPASPRSRGVARPRSVSLRPWARIVARRGMESTTSDRGLMCRARVGSRMKHGDLDTTTPGSRA